MILTKKGQKLVALSTTRIKPGFPRRVVRQQPSAGSRVSIRTDIHLPSYRKRYNCHLLTQKFHSGVTDSHERHPSILKRNNKMVERKPKRKHAQTRAHNTNTHTQTHIKII